MKYIIDSYAWIEYLNGSILGERVSEIIKGNNEIYSISMTVPEVISRVKRIKGNVDIAYNAITSNSIVIEIKPEIGKEAGLLHAEIKEKVKNFGLVDSLILTLARKLNAKILTGDQHFKGFKEAIMLK